MRTTLLLLPLALALRRKQPRGRSEVFVHLFEWSWADVAQECEDWLGPKGFHAVQVSPPTEHIQGSPWWTRYQPVTYKLTSRSGDEDAFSSMVKRCQAVGVSIYVDTVFNHCAGGSGKSITGSEFGGRTFPDFGPEDFHHRPNDASGNCAVSDYSDVNNVQYCDLQGLPDLCTECARVQDAIAAYLSRLIELGVAGIRVDAAKHMKPEDLKAIFSKVTDGDKLFKYAEVSRAPSTDAVKGDAYLSLGDVTEFNYNMKLDSLFAKAGQIPGLESLDSAPDLLPGSSAIVFVDNHDTQRAQDQGTARLTHKDPRLYLLANVFMLAYPYGYPQVMSSFHFVDFDQGPPAIPVHGSNGELRCGEYDQWVCEHRWTGIANMVAWRRTAGDLPVTHYQAAGADRVFFCRGDVACMALNRKDSEAWVLKLRLPLAPGDYCNIAESDGEGCPIVKVAADGVTRLRVPAQGFVALHAGARKQRDTEYLSQAQLPLHGASARSLFHVAAQGSLGRWTK
eukprot:TRINITY_DN91098_c0_g1_i1.p1 TRINITY_DN91098_c0_g1~~TRINITY_DN91098_c0_g1_i1.p1  ORF type:complete len:508 (+),score=95.56 TRINITY_DN91098_c0_g1_i1:77-1600(+)